MKYPYISGVRVSKTFSTLILLFYSLEVVSGECVVQGHKFLEETGSRFIRTEAKKIDGEGACSLIDPSVLIAASDTGPGLTCEIKYFANKVLKGSWTVSNIAFSGASTNLVDREWSTNKLEIMVRVHVEKGETKSLSVSQVYLESHESDCNDWRNAL